MSLWRTNVTVSGLLTEIIGISSQSPKLQLLIVPGNPGLASFYTVLLEQLYDAFAGTAEVTALCHLGHDSSNLGQGKVWCLDSQIQHKVDYLQQRVLLPGRAPAVIVGHSIGSYMVLKAIRQLEQDAATAKVLQEQLLKVVLLTPFLSYDWASMRQRVLRVAASCPQLLAAAAAGVGRWPGWLQDKLGAVLVPGAEPHAKENLRASLSYNAVRNNFHLAMHEFRDLDTPVNWQLIRALGTKVAVVCAPQDMWFPEQHYKELCSSLPGVEEYWDHSLTHAFPLDSKQCKRVMEIVHQTVTRALEARSGAASPQYSQHADNVQQDQEKQQVAASNEAARIGAGNQLLSRL